MLQVGGLEAQDQISVLDKEFMPNFYRLANLCTRDIFKLAHELGEDIPEYYRDEECSNMVEAYILDDIIEE